MYAGAILTDITAKDHVLLDFCEAIHGWRTRLRPPLTALIFV
jgi:hypothetical protein